MFSHYKIYKSTKGGYYSFKTKNGITYRCFFTKNSNSSSNNLLGLDVENPVFYFAFNRKEKIDAVVFDRQIGITIAEILNKFFRKNPSSIICYICENIDLKAIKRQGSFSRWLTTHNKEPKKVMIKGEVANIIYAGAIMLVKHPEAKKIETYFKKELKEFTETQKSGSIDIIE